MISSLKQLRAEAEWAYQNWNGHLPDPPVVQTIGSGGQVGYTQHIGFIAGYEAAKRRDEHYPQFCPSFQVKSLPSQPSPSRPEGVYRIVDGSLIPIPLS